MCTIWFQTFFKKKKKKKGFSAEKALGTNITKKKQSLFDLSPISVSVEYKLNKRVGTIIKSNEGILSFLFSLLFIVFASTLLCLHTFCY